MDKAIVIGAYHFLGFHVCNTLLNKGIEVTGILLNEMDKIPFLDEKRMEVGRNANFHEQSIFKLGHASDKTTKITLMISYYDFYMLHREALLADNKILKPIMEYIEHQEQLNLVLFLPMPMQMQEIGVNGHLIESFRNPSTNAQLFHLPSLYGTWQPSTFLFQQVIRSKFGKSMNKMKSTREWTKDIIFVDDAVETLMELIENGNSGNFLLESGKEHYWEECARFLQAGESFNHQKSLRNIKVNGDFTTVSVKRLSSISESLSIQIEHERWLDQSSMINSETEKGGN
ncbi:hypothetical protein [Neobacillus sp. LXY-1]|uniref:hypothetical protein n=1 Tax=Neobacillus sp. LXY-1 TaxID=3379133 RepID=UPI003EE3E34D